MSVLRIDYKLQKSFMLFIADKKFICTRPLHTQIRNYVDYTKKITIKNTGLYYKWRKHIVKIIPYWQACTKIKCLTQEALELDN
jgi:predicted thioredoxin/glutaredoxin